MANELLGHPNLYLRQHGNNPVDWKSWSAEVWKNAIEKNKLVIVSIGYSACHWCHVMEKECFQDVEVGQYMNDHFLSIKIDREERPDIDQTYMSAIQAMGKNGGWPLNCICLPDGRPIFGGTYFNKTQWLQILNELKTIYFDQHDTVLHYASELQSHLDNWQTRFDNEDHHLTPLTDSIERSKRQLDLDFGGTQGSPKFPMPPMLLFLIQFQKYYPKDWLNDWIQTTFSEMTAGGLWDWVDGGFSRYSVDHRWHIPHFEKMLYDNAQLYKVFAILQKITPNPSYELIKEGIDRWLEHFLKSPMNLYYSATDADSEGEEGKYFCWEQSELQALLKNEFDDLDKHFDVSHHSYWEDGKIVLRKRTPELPHNWHQLQEKLINKRKEKTPPQTDQKILLSWNALLVQAWCVSDIDVSKAVHLFERLKFHFYQDGKWWGTMYENGMLKEVHSDGLAFTLKACLDLYFQTSNLQYWQSCQAILNQLEATFKDNSSCYYYFSEDSQLFVATKDLDDQVIPSSNAVIAECLYWMGILDGNMHWIEQAREMTFKRLQMDHPLLSASHWLQNQLLFDQKASIIIHGSSTSRPKNKWHIHRFIQIHSSDEAPLIMKNKSTEENLYYVCNTEQCNTISPHIEEFLSPS